MLITHVSAQGSFFFAYSSSMVLRGGVETTPQTLPTIIPELQNRSVVSVVYGTNHFSALTSSGKLLTGGEYSKGALGLGGPRKPPAGSLGTEGKQKVQVQNSRPPPSVMVPSEVKFDQRLGDNGVIKKYCFAAAVGQSHTAVLAVDLVEDEFPLEDFEHQQMSGPSADSTCVHCGLIVVLCITALSHFFGMYHFSAVLFCFAVLLCFAESPRYFEVCLLFGCFF